MRAAILLAVLVFLAATTDGLAEEGAVPEPKSYRLEDYRSKTPRTLASATVIDTPRAFEIWSGKKAVFVDSLPHAPKPAGLPKNAVWREMPRFDIPRSIWLPDTGFGELSDKMQRYFESGLAQATENDKTKALVFYCLADCWMSWNAAKRALTLGYSNVFWYPEGTDGWAAAGHPQEERKPVPRD
jgi:PQQ-dependent catabolism-associated CXXCW motif protein